MLLTGKQSTVYERLWPSRKMPWTSKLARIYMSIDQHHEDYILAPPCRVSIETIVLAFKLSLSCLFVSVSYSSHFVFGIIFINHSVKMNLSITIMELNEKECVTCLRHIAGGGGGGFKGALLGTGMRGRSTTRRFIAVCYFLWSSP